MHEINLLWERMIGTITQDMEGKKSSHINNPAICYFQKILVNTSYFRGDNGSVIMKELFFIDCMFKPSQINSATFMLSHLKTIAKARWGNIFIGGYLHCTFYGFRCRGYHTYVCRGKHCAWHCLFSGTNDN